MSDWNRREVLFALGAGAVELAIATGASPACFIEAQADCRKLVRGSASRQLPAKILVDVECRLEGVDGNRYLPTEAPGSRIPTIPGEHCEMCLDELVSV